MISNTRLFALATLASALVNALPLDTNQVRDVVPRAKSYSVVNVGGDAPTEATKTIEVTNAGPTVTARVTTTIIETVPAPIAPSTSRSTKTTPSSTRTKATTASPSTTATPTPVFVTVTVTDDAGPTEYYDDGMWHTSYRIKTFETIAASSTALPA